jgi:hypothetical protein
VFRPKHRYDLACGNAFASIHLGLAGADGVVQTRAIFIVQIVAVLHHGERDFATIREIDWLVHEEPAPANVSSNGQRHRL